MKHWVILLSYLGTLGAGVGIGVLSTRSYFARKESERADKEIYSMKETMRRSYIKEEKEDFAPAQKLKEPAAVDIPLYREYHTFSAQTDDIRAEAEHPKEDEDSKKPYFIDIDDFDNLTLGYGKKELSYYMDDGTLVDEEENVISIIDTVGITNLETFENSLESCCYIRNESLKDDYEISKVFGSYGAMNGDDY